MSAEIIPFPNAVAEALEQYAALARAGVITGVVIGAVGRDRLGGDIHTVVSGVNYREERMLITALEDAAISEMLDAQEY